MKTFLAAVLLTILISFPAYGAERTICINRPILDIVGIIYENLAAIDDNNELNLDQLEKVGEGAKFSDLDLETTSYSRPKLKYYRFDTKLVKPMGKLWCFEQETVVQGFDNATQIKLRVDIGYGKTFKFPLAWLNPIKNKIITGVENKILTIAEHELNKTKKK